MMPSQRVRGAAIRAGNKSSNGPLRVQSNVIFIHRVFCNVKTYVSCQGYDSTSKERVFHEFKVAPRISFYSSLAELASVRVFLFLFKFRRG